MSTIITLDPNNTRTQSLNALGTYNYTVGPANTSGSPAGAGLITVSFAAQVEPKSGLVVTIQQNSVTKATAGPPAVSQTPTSSVTGAGAAPFTAPVFTEIGQAHIDLNILLNCAQGDVISVILSSSLSHDSFLNGIKGILNIRQGQV
jgi:hypothetical protein